LKENNDYYVLIIVIVYINQSFLKNYPTSWESSENYINGKKNINSLKIVNDTVERAVKLMEQYNAILTLDEDQKQFILKYVQKHWKIYTDCKKSTLLCTTILTFFIL